MGKLKKWKKDIVKGIKDAGIYNVVSYFTAATGLSAYSRIAGVASTKTGRKTARRVYDNYTGHYGRQQERLAEGQQRADIIEQEEQRRQALEQRKYMIDQQREKKGIGSNYKTSTRFDEVRGKGKQKETLG